MSVYPYKFEPIYKDKIWGGRALERLFGRMLPAGQNIGESWELADLPEGQSVVANGRDAGRTITDLIGTHGPELLGAVRPLSGGRFPLLLKLLDANDILSLQVHPDARAARRLGPPAALKAECWHIVESRQGFVLKGVRPGVGRADFAAAIAEPDANLESLGRLLVRYDVRRNDFHYLPAGTVHALGAGVVVAEIQTPSDTTYRVSDWGRGREIHVREAMECIHFRPSSDTPAGAAGDVLVKTDYFGVRKFSAGAGERSLAKGRCKAWMVLGGRGTISSRDGAAEFVAGDTLLLPAGCAELTLTADEPVQALEVTIPARR